MVFGEHLKRLREKAGLTQEALARAADVSVSYVAKLERSGRETAVRAMDPAWSVVQRFAQALGVDCTAFAEAKAVEADVEIAAMEEEPPPPPTPPSPKKGRKPKK